MKSYEFSRFFHPKLGQFVYRHKGTGLIVDNIFKPMRAVASAVFNKFAKPVAKKALQSGISHAGDKLGKKAAEKSGDLIMKKLGNMGKASKASRGAKQPATKAKQPASKASRDAKRRGAVPLGPTRSAPPPQGESSAEILNRLISGQGVKRNKRI